MMIEVFLWEVNIGYMELIRDDGINPAASITGEVWLKLDWNRGCNSCLVCVILEDLYQFEISEIIDFWIISHGIVSKLELAWQENRCVVFSGD